MTSTVRKPRGTILKPRRENVCARGRSLSKNVFRLASSAAERERAAISVDKSRVHHGGSTPSSAGGLQGTVTLYLVHVGRTRHRGTVPRAGPEPDQLPINRTLSPSLGKSLPADLEPFPGACPAPGYQYQTGSILLLGVPRSQVAVVGLGLRVGRSRTRTRAYDEPAGLTASIPRPCLSPSSSSSSF